jgi:Mce-associated membrane protein
MLIGTAAALVVALAGFGAALGLAVSWHGGHATATAATQTQTVTAAPGPGATAATTVIAAAPKDPLAQSALATARQYALDFSTYDYRHIDQDFAKIASELTPAFRTEYQKTSASLKSIVVQYRGVATATVQGMGITSLTANQAVVVVFLDQQVTNTSTKTPRIDRNRLQITLQRNGSGWLMSDLQLK